LFNWPFFQELGCNDIATGTSACSSHTSGSFTVTCTSTNTINFKHH